jgi:hypothetical protein
MKTMSALVLLSCVAVGCVAPAAECNADALYPSVNGDVPLCPWLTDRCDEYVDYNGDGVSDLNDLGAWCQYENDGNSLTLDVSQPPADGNYVWCYTCD